MGPRKKLPQYLVSTSYHLHWRGEGGISVHCLTFNSEAEAMERASEWVQEMRAGGAATTVRRVSVKLWDTEIRNPPLFHASYYDEEQGLSADEAYAARVHERHWMFDRGRGFTYNGLPLTFSYPEWDDLEPKPDVCPHCGRGLSKDLQRQAVERQLGRAVAI